MTGDLRERVARAICGAGPACCGKCGSMLAMADAALSVIPAAQGWRPISECPIGKIVLMWGATDIEDGRIKNWKMATGNRSQHFDGELFYWDGRWLDKPYDPRPTHWQPLPSPPVVSVDGKRGR